MPFSGTWIVTDGREKGVGDVISKSVKGYAEAYGMQRLQVIGLVPWRRLYSSHVLRSIDFLVKKFFWSSNQVLYLASWIIFSAS